MINKININQINFQAINRVKDVNFSIDSKQYQINNASNQDIFVINNSLLNFSSVEAVEKYSKTKLGVNLQVRDEAFDKKKNLFDFLKSKEKLDKIKSKRQADREKNYLALANKTINSLCNLKKLGYELPPNVISDHTQFVGEGKRSPGCFVYENPKNIYLNPGFKWEDIDKILKDHFKNNICSSSSSNHVLNHEMGHYLHYKENPDKYISQKESLLFPELNKLPSDLSMLVTQKVSSYATRNIRDFVAEVFAGIIDGNNYPDEIMKAYNKYGGPKTKEKS
ncbi:MAG: hypothetical protein ACD_20C00357G0011 [uncultured bacterium]|nr:MAG: hypothetical protein ACD_20C00357G0011 [uncultured bacterium]HBH17357.1 hypothetical protein [Cyanobacteria bacterium UBA9579]